MNRAFSYREWQNPSSKYRSAPFWSWNSKLDPQRLVDEITEMHRSGMGGFFMHSRYGLKTPYLGQEWFECVHACVQKARQLGMKAYLYDEDRWPSGSAGGGVTRTNPGFGITSVMMAPAGKTSEAAGRIATFAVELDESGRLRSCRRCDGEQTAGGMVFEFSVVPGKPSGYYNDGQYLDTMNPQAVAEFIRITHHAYAERFGCDFGDLIPAVFTDEPYYGPHDAKKPPEAFSIPWTAGLPGVFKQRRGYDICDHLPVLFFTPAGEGFSKVRYDFFRTATEMFTEGFSLQVGQWCSRHNIALTGHLLAEESLQSQVSYIGAAMPHYEHMQWPGIDILCDKEPEILTAKQATSAADQLGKERVLSELYGCTGWDWPLEGHKFVGDWQLALGVNFRCTHLTHYSLAGGAKRDYPASIYAHSPWWSRYRCVEDYFSRLCFLLTRGKAVRDVLVLHPIESVWGLFGPVADWPNRPWLQMDESLKVLLRTLLGEHYDWDVADESLLVRYGKVSAGGNMQVGKMRYKMVIVPPSVTMRETTLKLLKRFQKAGGKLLFVGRTHTHVEGQADGRVCGLVNSADRCGQSPNEFLPAVERLLLRRVSITERPAAPAGEGRQQTCVWTMLRKVKGGQILFIQSHDRKSPRSVQVRVEGKGPVVLWDAQTAGRLGVKSQQEGGEVCFELELPPTGSAALTLGLADVTVDRPKPTADVAGCVEYPGPFRIELSEPDTMPLDYCTYKIGDGPWSPSVHSLRADKEIRAAFGLAPRDGGAHQPWYLYATGKVDLAPRGPCCIKRTFHVTTPPVDCRLALEGPGNFEILVNGKPAGQADNWWVDPDIRTIDITSLLQPGDNEILCSFNYRPDMEIEDMYLVGNFGVTRRDPSAPSKPGNLTLIDQPKEIRLGSWVGQGLDFYGGGVKYILPVSKPSAGRVRVSLGGVDCTCAAVHVNGREFVMPWAPFEADVTDALHEGINEIQVEVIGGRKNILGPLHVPWMSWTGPGEFDPGHPKWTDEYLLTDHGIVAPIKVQTLL